MSNFPLIQQPSPFQQLADTLNGIRARRDARDQVAFERQQTLRDEQRRDAYLALNQQEAVDRQTQHAKENDLAISADALHRAQLGAQIQQMAAQRVNQAIDNKRQLTSLLLQNLPPGVTMSLARVQQEAAGNRYLPGTGTQPTTMEQDVATARGRATPGLQGSAIRTPVPGSSNGVTYTPETLNYNAPHPGGSGGGGQTQADADAALGTLMAATRRLNDAENGDRTATQHPWTGLPGRMLAGAGRKIFGDQNELSQALSTAGLTPGQQDVAAVEDEWTHAYLVHLPKYRGSVPMYDNVKHAFFPRTGVSDPRVMASFRSRRNAAVSRIALLRRNGATEEQIQSALEGDLNALSGGGPRQSVAPPVTPDQAPAYLRP